MRIFVCLLGAMICFTFCSFGQVDSTLNSITQFPDRLFHKIQNKTARFDDQVTRQTEKYLARLSKKEEKLRHKLYQKDSVASNNIFAGEQAKYASLKASLESACGQNAPNPLHEYIPGVDSMQSALKFISNSDSKISGFPSQKLQSVQAADAQLLQLEARLQSANDIDQFIKQREQQLKNQLSQFGMGKDLAGLNKEAFYYQQQLVEYKNILHDPDKLENR